MENRLERQIRGFYHCNDPRNYPNSTILTSTAPRVSRTVTPTQTVLAAFDSTHCPALAAHGFGVPSDAGCDDLRHRSFLRCGEWVGNREVRVDLADGVLSAAEDEGRLPASRRGVAIGIA